MDIWKTCLKTWPIINQDFWQYLLRRRKNVQGSSKQGYQKDKCELNYLPNWKFETQGPQNSYKVGSKNIYISKVQKFWEGHKIWKNLPLKIWCYWVASNFKRKIFFKKIGLLRISELYCQWKNNFLLLR